MNHEGLLFGLSSDFFRSRLCPSRPDLLPLQRSAERRHPVARERDRHRCRRWLQWRAGPVPRATRACGSGRASTVCRRGLHFTRARPPLLRPPKGGSPRAPVPPLSSHDRPPGSRDRSGGDDRHALASGWAAAWGSFSRGTFSRTFVSFFLTFADYFSIT